MFRLSIGGFVVIEIRKDEDGRYYKTDMTEFENELKLFGFGVSSTNIYSSVYNRSYKNIETQITKGDFKQIVVLGDVGYSYRKQELIFPEENGVIKFDANVVEQFYQKWKKRDDQKKIRTNVSQFKGPLVLSFIRGTLDSSDIEYTDMSEDTYHGGGIFVKCEDFQLCYVLPNPGELAKLNFENVKVGIVFEEFRVNDVHLKNFLKNPKESLDALRIICTEYDTATKKLNKIKTEYETQIEKIKNELSETYSKFSKMNLDKYRDSIKKLNKPTKC